MIRRHHLVEIKRVKELGLSTLSPPHQGLLPRITISVRRNHGSSGVSTRVVQHGEIPGSCHTKAQGISSPAPDEALLMCPRNDGELRWSIMSDWTRR